jgi:hypothetical protein
MTSFIIIVKNMSCAFAVSKVFVRMQYCIHKQSFEGYNAMSFKAKVGHASKVVTDEDYQFSFEI